MSIEEIGFTDVQLSYLVMAIDDVIAYKKSKRSYNNTNDVEEQYRIQEIDILRSIKKRIKEYLKEKNK